MLKRYQNMEKAYTRLFSEVIENDGYDEFYDDNLPGMYVHNFIMFKENINKEHIVKIINEQIKIRKAANKDFLRVEFNFPVELDFLHTLNQKADVGYFDVMAIKTASYKHLNGNPNCEIKHADSENIFEDGKKVDIFANSEMMGRDFSVRRIERKLAVYKTKPIDFFVCYENDEPIGNCELFLKPPIGKIEDFDMIHTHQKKGFGTTFLKTLLMTALEKEIKEVYLVTDSDDTAKEMYTKCGFQKVGIKTELIFDF